MALTQGCKFGRKMKGVKLAVTLDWKDDPQAAAEELNKLLKEHGLEFVSHETDGDFYAFSVAKLPK